MIERNYKSLKWIDGVKFKWCNYCNELKNYNECFGDRKDEKGRLKKKSKCKTCENRAIEIKRRMQPSGQTLFYRKRRLMQKYKMTYEVYTTLLAAQNNKCAICGIDISGITPHVDHNHTTGETRGLLCARCNHCIGHARESYYNLLRSIWYLHIHEKPENDCTFEEFIANNIARDSFLLYAEGTELPTYIQ